MKKLLRKFLLFIFWRRVSRQVKIQKPFVVAITGSVGKTSAREAVALVLAKKDRPILKTEGSLNTEIGNPLSLMGYKVPPSGFGWIGVIHKAIFGLIETYSKRPYYILEYSSDKPGDISFLAGKLQPDVAVLTYISPVHMQFYTNFEALVTEKTSLLGFIKAGGDAVLNQDDLSQDVPFGSKMQYRAKNIKWEEAGIKADFEYKFQNKSESIQVQTNLIGEHQLNAVLAAGAVGLLEGVSEEKIKEAILEYQPPKGRGRLIEGKNETTIIDDSYNASPASMKAGLTMVHNYAGGKGRRSVAVLGNMAELGDDSKSLHEEVAKFAFGLVDQLVLSGPFADAMCAAAVEAGFDPEAIVVFESADLVVDVVEDLIKARDIVYVKGSQNGVRLERAVKKLMKYPELAEQYLVRQEKRWL